MYPRCLVLARILAVPALLLTGAQLAGQPVAAAGNRPLTFADFANPISAQNLSGTADGAVAGVRFARAIGLPDNGASVTLFAGRYHGYAALSFQVGISDTDSNRTSTLVIQIDGKPWRSVTRSWGQAAQTVTVPFGKGGSITLVADPNSSQAIDSLVIGNPVLVTGVQGTGAGPRMLKLGDFANAIDATDVTGTADGAIAGVAYHRAISLGTNSTQMSYFTHRYPGYGRLSFKVGIADTDSGRTSTLVVRADGKDIRSVTVSSGQNAKSLTIPFGKAGVITLIADPYDDQGIDSIVIADPTLLP